MTSVFDDDDDLPYQQLSPRENGADGSSRGPFDYAAHEDYKRVCFVK